MCKSYIVQFIILANETGKQDNEAVQGKDTPVGKRPAGEVPVAES